MVAIALFITTIYTLSCIISDILVYSYVDKMKQEIYDGLKDIRECSDNTEEKDKMVVLSTLIFEQVKTAVVAISIAYLLWQLIKFYFL